MGVCCWTWRCDGSEILCFQEIHSLQSKKTDVSELQKEREETMQRLQVSRPQAGGWLLNWIVNQSVNIYLSPHSLHLDLRTYEINKRKQIRRPHAHAYRALKLKPIVTGSQWSTGISARLWKCSLKSEQKPCGQDVPQKAGRHQHKAHYKSHVLSK